MLAFDSSLLTHQAHTRVREGDRRRERNEENENRIKTEK
jgi:hypothetical protein